MIRAALVLFITPMPAIAVTLDMPGNATLTQEEVSAPDDYAMPTGPWTIDGIPILNETGEVRQQAWRVDAAGLTTLQLLAPLQNQLETAGFETLFTCTDDACGGFDFRFATDVIPAPNMHVDLGDYRYMAFEHHGEEGHELISLLASRSTSAGFIQVIRVGAATGAPVVAAQAPTLRATGPAVSGNLVQELENTGRFILSDLVFETGSAQLDDIEFGSLSDLSDYLAQNPNRSVALVGHTDSVGSLDGNIALSKRRAGSVLERLVSVFDVPRSQLEAEGVGYLTPIATNLTDKGREQNRRVEVILTSTEQ